MYKKNVQGWMKHWDFILLDILCLNLAYVMAGITRFGLRFPFAGGSDLSLMLVLSLLDLMVLIVGEGMKNVLRRGYYREFAQTVKQVSLVMLLGLGYLFAAKNSALYSRLMLGAFAAYYCLLSYGARLLWKRHLVARPKRKSAALYIITTASQAEDVVGRYKSDRMSHYLLKGVCLLDLDQTGEDVLGIPVNANADTVLPMLCREWVDEVVLSVPQGQTYPKNLVEQLTDMGIIVHIEMEHMASLTGRKQEVEKIADRTVLTVGISMASPLQICLKRIMDIMGGLVGCMLTLVLTVVIGPMIYRKSPGPIFFAQTRVGKNGKLFKMYKFRSMYLDAEARKAELMANNRMGSGGLMFKLDYDPRIIGCEKQPDGTIKKGIGNYIRDWSLDEFPQFWNVLKGDLSLVGTRPPTVDEWERYELHHRARLAIKPGITGLWQVSGRSKITDFEQVVELDKKYIQEWSLGLDIKILLRTVGAVLRKDGSM